MIFNIKVLLINALLFPMLTWAQLYKIDRNEKVQSALKRINERRIYSFIKTFSSYKTRHHATKTGIKSAKDLRKYWQKISANRSDIQVLLIHHSDTPQPSVVVHIKGITDNRIVLGGHIDSINDHQSDVNAIAPGAGDNAAGVAVLTEVLKVLVDLNYRPVNTISLYGYAAEEVGLLGSKSIAQNLAQDRANILGVVQLDGVNYNFQGKDLVLIADYTNYFQNLFLGRLIDTYLNASWSYDRCGYPCSDHYSWWVKGVPVSFPFESELRYENPNIHSELDTIGNMNYNANHATLFAKLALAFVIEMDR
ncbi:MAG: hypothetical protein CME64_16830 [Halobacteriovoraceae bacterium]|nr:hypothetical protein [Halobacteriovoraceae bacterium]|tara:strand:- start:189565 stop:190488 length:924 start_codon:yes stop_codon:yes gene_type:complete